ncbi:MAG: UDP-N-acetylmuramate dehydrogenase [Acidimicrobiia bacterium]|nr:UDP-N-acetylmuramate dehydrogenase [Acidimicrobiia bacterium]
MPAAGAEPARGGPTDPTAAAMDVLGELAERAVPLGPLTTYRVGGPAAIFVRATSRDDLVVVAEALRRSRLPLLIVGRGSNLLVSDVGFRGIALSVAALTDSFEIDTSEQTVRAGAAVLLPVLARQIAAAGLTGFEWAVGVPGSIGGAVRMNAGGHGSDMAACLTEATVGELGTPPAGTARDRVRTVAAAELGLRFRGSALGTQSVVLDARLQLRTGDRAAAEREIGEIVAWRRANQPGGQNAGSVFVNPVPGEVSAGELIDAAGLRGRRIGSAAVSDKHANFIQADEGGSADDVHELMQIVRREVEDRTGYALRSEIRLIGFGDEG